MQGKRVVVFGVANEQSIAWHIARHLLDQGAEVHITYQQKFKSRVLQLLRGAAAQPAGVHARVPAPDQNPSTSPLRRLL